MKLSAALDAVERLVELAPIFVPEDGPERDWVPVEPVREVDPPVRMHFINSLPPHKRATALIRGYVEGLVESQGDPATTKGRDAKRAGKAAARGFLKAWQAVEADGNDMGVELAVMPAGPREVQFFFNVHGVGPVVWMPVLVTAANNHTHHIMRETGPNRVAIAPGPRQQSDTDEPPKRRIPPKVETVLVKRK